MAEFKFNPEKQMDVLRLNYNIMKQCAPTSKNSLIKKLPYIKKATDIKGPAYECKST